MIELLLLIVAILLVLSLIGKVFIGTGVLVVILVIVLVFWFLDRGPRRW